MTKSLIPSISELVGQRIVHILPSYGCGCIEDAYLTEDRDIHVVISFDNQRKANPFSLKKCINNNLISFVNMDIGIEKIDSIILNTVSRAEHIQNRQDERERKEVFEYLTEKRKVPFFVHFTPIQNLPSIFKYGIMPRSALAEKKLMLLCRTIIGLMLVWITLAFLFLFRIIVCCIVKLNAPPTLMP